MKKILLSSGIALLIFCSCQKEIVPGEADQPTVLTGTWNFVSMDAQTQSVVDQDDAGVHEKTVTNSNYTTTNNSGFITFGNSDFSSKAGYSVSTNLTSLSYQNNMLFDSSTIPFQFAVPPSTSSGSYEVVGKDSIYFPNGSLISVHDTTYPSSAYGAKFSIDGNSLTITQSIHQVYNGDIGGGEFSNEETGTFVLRFSKK